jgi:hypothetical protein
MKFLAQTIPPKIEYDETGRIISHRVIVGPSLYNGKAWVVAFLIYTSTYVASHVVPLISVPQSSPDRAHYGAQEFPFSGLPPTPQASLLKPEADRRFGQLVVAFRQSFSIVNCLSAMDKVYRACEAIDVPPDDGV